MQINKPVRVQWMRSDEHVWGPHMPGLTVDIAGTLGSNGDDQLVVRPGLGDHGRLGHRLLPAAAAPREREGAARMGARAGSRRRCTRSPNQTIIAHTVDPTVRPMYMRTVQGIQTTFITESFMDELAAAAAIDPIQFRLNHMPSHAGACDRDASGRPAALRLAVAAFAGSCVEARLC